MLFGLFEGRLKRNRRKFHEKLGILPPRNPEDCPQTAQVVFLIATEFAQEWNEICQAIEKLHTFPTGTAGSLNYVLSAKRMGQEALEAAEGKFNQVISLANGPGVELNMKENIKDYIQPSENMADFSSSKTAAAK